MEDVCVNVWEEVWMGVVVGYTQDSGNDQWGWLSVGVEGEEPERQGPPANIVEYQTYEINWSTALDVWRHGTSGELQCYACTVCDKPRLQTST